jgi:hypothetical protein
VDICCGGRGGVADRCGYHKRAGDPGGDSESGKRIAKRVNRKLSKYSIHLLRIEIKLALSRIWS